MDHKDRTNLLSGIGMSLGSLHKLWARAESGHLDSMLALAVLSAGRPKFGDLFDEFRRGVSGDRSVVAQQLKKAPRSPWDKLRLSNKDAQNPTSAGLPSLGKRK